MSDIDDELEDGESPEASTSKRRSGLATLLPTILKFAAIGIGALIFIVTVVIITFNILNSGGRSQTAITDPSSPYLGRRPTYSYFTDIGQITTNTRDTVTRHTITVDVNIGYDRDDLTMGSELNLRRFELRDFLRRFFNGKFVHELEDEERVKREILEQLNTRYLDNAKVRIILFDRFDISEVF